MHLHTACARTLRTNENRHHPIRHCHARGPAVEVRPWQPRTVVCGRRPARHARRMHSSVVIVLSHCTIAGRGGPRLVSACPSRQATGRAPWSGQTGRIGGRHTRRGRHTGLPLHVERDARRMRGVRPHLRVRPHRNAGGGWIRRGTADRSMVVLWWCDLPCPYSRHW